MAEDLFKYPFVSVSNSSSSFLLYLSQKAKGKTIHLLKSSAKTVRKAPKRKKYELLDQSQRNTIDLFASYKKNQMGQQKDLVDQVLIGSQIDSSTPGNQKDAKMNANTKK